MLELFRKNIFLNMVLLLPYIVLVRLGTLIFPSRYYYTYDEGNVLLEYVYGLLSTPISQSILAILLIYIQTLYINRISINNKLALDVSYFAGVLYVLFTSLTPDIATFSPILIANTFVLLAVSNLFKTYKNLTAKIQIFNVGFFLSIAAYFHKPYIFFFLFAFIGLMILRSFKWHERLQYFSGYAVFIFLVSGLYFSMGIKISDSIQSSVTQFGLVIFRPITLSEGITLGVFALMLAFIILNYNTYIGKKNIQVQKMIDLLYWLLLASLPMALFSAEIFIVELKVLAIGMSMLFALTLSANKNVLTNEFIHILFLGIITYTHLFH